MAKPEILSQDQIKEQNRVNVINIIKKHGTITKYEIAQELRLSIPTVTANINSLLEEGYVLEAGVAKSTGGRKPVILQFNKDARYSIGVNISTDHVDILLTNLEMETIAQASFPSSEEESFDKILQRIKDEVETILSKEKISLEKVLGLGLSLPGLVNEDQLILESAPNLGVHDFDFHPFEASLGIRIFIENEANVAAYAEIKEAKQNEISNVVYVSITDGVGTGIIIDGQIYKSKNKKAGEFGHMRITDEALRCKCNRTGCWELYASKKALLNYYKEASGNRVKTLEELFGKSIASEPKLKIAIDKYLDYLFIGIENIILALNPEYVIIGGEIGKYKDKFLDYVNEKNQLKSAYMEYEGTRITFSKLLDRGSLIGAALLPMQEVFEFKKSVIG